MQNTNAKKLLAGTPSLCSLLPVRSGLISPDAVFFVFSTLPPLKSSKDSVCSREERARGDNAGAAQDVGSVFRGRIRT